MRTAYTLKFCYTVLLCSLCCTVTAAPVTNQQKKISAIPLFIENKGQLADQHHQLRNDIDYTVNTGAVTLFIGNEGLQYQWAKYKGGQTIEREKGNNGKPTEDSITYYVMNVKLLGANKHAIAEQYDIQEYRENYYLSQCPKGVSAKSCKKIVYKNIYNNIDWVLYADEKNNNSIKYDFIVHPGGNANDIKLQYEGATTLKLNNGAFEAITPLGNIIEQKPYSYLQESKQTVNTSYLLTGNTLSFNTPAYDGTLVIDPIINWGTYYGHPDFTIGTAVAADSVGLVYLCGYTKSTVAISSLAGSYQYTFGGGLYDGFIVKFLSDGSRNWATYFGNWGSDQINAASLDKTGHLLIAGFSTGTGIVSSPGSHQPNNGSYVVAGGYDYDAFVGKVYSNGLFAWGTFYGGFFYDEAFAVTSDNSDNVYVGGNTTSSNGIHSTGAFQTTPSNGFIAKFDKNGTRQWGTYHNGTVNVLTCDADYNVYAGGFTTATTGVATTGAHLGTIAGGAGDAYIAKFNGAGTKLWGTYYGGYSYDEILSMATDSMRNLYVGGTTTSPNGIATTGSFKSYFSGAAAPVASDAFLSKFNKAGVQQWGTYIGDTLGADKLLTLYTGPDSKIYCFGRTGSKGGIATPGNHSTSNAGPPASPPPSPFFDPECDAFIIKFAPDGTRKWGTYFGGPGWEYGATGTTAFGRIYIAGTTISASGIATSNGYQDTLNGTVSNVRAFLAQFQADTSVFIKTPYIDTNLCAGDPLVIRYGVTNEFGTPNTFTVQLSNSAGSFASPRNIGTRVAKTEGTVNCIIPDTTSQGTQYRLRIISSSPKDTFYNYDINIKIWKYLKPIAAGTDTVCENSPINLFDARIPLAPDYSWTGPNGFTGILSNVTISAASLAATGNYIVESNNNGCKAKDTIRVDVFGSPSKGIITGDTTICIGDTLHLHAACDSPGVFFQWQAPGGFPQTADYVIPVTTMADAGRYIVTPISIIAYCGGAPDTVKVLIHPLPNPVIPTITPVCSGDSIKLTVNDSTAITNHIWSGPAGFTSNAKSPVILNSKIANSGSYIVTNTNSFGCKSSDTADVLVKPLPNPVEATSNSPICSRTTLQFTTNNGTNGATYSWSGPAGFSSTLQNPSINNTEPATSGIYKLIADLNGCKSEDTTLVIVYQNPDTPVATSNSPLYVGEILTLKVNNPQTGAAYLWSGPNAFAAYTPVHSINSVIPSIAGIYTVTASIGNCSTSDTIKVEILQKEEQEGKVLFVYPNPNSGRFTIFATLSTNSDVPINIYQTDGKLVHSEIAKPQNKKLDHVVDVRGKLASGVYRVKVMIDGKKYTISVVIH